MDATSPRPGDGEGHAGLRDGCGRAGGGGEALVCLPATLVMGSQRGVSSPSADTRRLQDQSFFYHVLAEAC